MQNDTTSRMWRAIFILCEECSAFGEGTVDAKYIHSVARKCGVSCKKLAYEWSIQLKDFHEYGMFVDLI